MFLKKILIALLLLFMPTGIVYADNCTEHAYASIALDVSSSAIALNQEGVYEVNPLYGKDPNTGVLLGSAALRMAGAYLLDKNDHAWINCYVASVTYGAAMNNAAVASGIEDGKYPLVFIGVSIPFW